MNKDIPEIEPRESQPTRFHRIRCPSRRAISIVLGSQNDSVETRSEAGRSGCSCEAARDRDVDRLRERGEDWAGLKTCSTRHVEISDELRSVLESAIDPGFQWLELRGVGR